MCRMRWISVVWIVCVWTVLYLLLNSTVFTIFPHVIKSIKPCGFKCSDDKDASYLIKTLGCTIPDFSLKEIMRHRKPPYKKKVCSRNAQLTEEKGQHLIFYKERVSNYKLPFEAVSCYYQAIMKDSGKPVLQEMVAIVEERTAIVDEGILVTCFNNTHGNNTIFYQIVHYFVQPRTGRKKREMFKEKFGSRSDHPEKLSVVLLGTDAVSRYNAIRHMPNTYHYVTEKLGALDFRGYNKVAENTLPNTYAIMFGYNHSELNKHECLKNATFLDNCPIIWKAFDDEGYLTAFGEDVVPKGIFDYSHGGFMNNDVDLSPRNAFAVAGNKGAHGIKGFRSLYALCEGMRMRISVIHDYSLAVAEEFKDVPYFGFYWSSTVTHDSLRMARIADDYLLRLMTRFQDNGYLNHTIVLLISDHGLRYGPIRHTYMGQIEERLPFLFAVFPLWFKKVYPVAWKNLLINTRRLTSNLDIHETLHSLASGDFATNTKRSSKPGRGQSLFDEVPTSRSCSDVSIPEFFCTCEKTIEVDIEDPTVMVAAEAATEAITLSLQQFSDCAPLKLDKVLSARLALPSNSTQPRSAMHKVATYIVEFQTKPGGARLEAMVRKQAQKFTLVGEALRTNRYGNQSHCINHFTLRKYCFCKDLLQPQAVS